MIDQDAYKALPPPLWGEAQEKKKKQGTKGESPWYIEMIERIAIAAKYLINDPTLEHMQELKDAIEHWDKIMGWDGTMAHREVKEDD